MASIPLNTARRGLDTGNTVSYPAGSPLGAAVTGFGNTLSAIGERHREMQEQQERLAAAVQRRLFTERVAEAESQALTNSPRDGSGLHEALYGQVDPISGEVVKPGQYDLIVNDVLEQVPSSQRAAFVRHAQAERPIGARRAAQAQLQLRGAYENDQWEQARGAWLKSIAGGDPDNEAAFQARRRDGLDFLATMALDPQIRLQAQKAWEQDLAAARVSALIGRDPRQALALLGQKLQGAGRSVVDAMAAAPQAGQADQGDQIVPGITSEVAADAAATSSQDPDVARMTAAKPWITNLSPDARADLGHEAKLATTAEQVSIRKTIEEAESQVQYAMNSMVDYAGPLPSDEDYEKVFGPTEGSLRSRALKINANIGAQTRKMRGWSNQEIRSALREDEPRPGASPEEAARYELFAAAAQSTLQRRYDDPVGYVETTFGYDAQDWSTVSTPEQYKAAIGRLVAAQRGLGFQRILALPRTAARDLAIRFNDPGVPREQRMFELSSIFLGIRDPEVRLAMARQVMAASRSNLQVRATTDPDPGSKSVDAQLDGIAEDLSAIAVNPAWVQFEARPIWQKPFTAADDIVRLTANGATLGWGDKFSAGLDSWLNDESYDAALARNRAATEDAQNRSGSAGTVADLAGGALTGAGIEGVGSRILGRLGAAGITDGLSGIKRLIADTALMGAQGAGYGGLEALGKDEDFWAGMAKGGGLAASNNLLAKGAGSIGLALAEKLPANLDLGKLLAKAESPLFSTVKSSPAEIMNALGEAASTEGERQRKKRELRETLAPGADKKHN